ncbi:MAG: TetR/AcrR family transcriptional regulator [Actinomycetaceae bacterium]|nr:TetR/AcrR family transcriptional regulator [Actinomycetaceae bacterium]
MAKRTRMTGVQRREQLIDVARSVFAAHGFDGTSIEEIAAAAKVSKPVVYEHFGGKEGIYAVVVDREVQGLVSTITESLQAAHTPRAMAEGAALGLLTFIETNTDGFRILVQDAPSNRSTGTYWSVLGDVASKVEHVLAHKFKVGGLNPAWAPMYAQMLVGLVAQLGQWWLEERKPDKRQVAAHAVNLAWYGLKNLKADPELVTIDKNGNTVSRTRNHGPSKDNASH